MSGFPTLFHKEILRFWKVRLQTVVAPIMTALLYLMIFNHTFGNRAPVFPGIAYTSFLLPGLIMMAMLQNAFSNASSSLIQSRITGNLVFILLPPLSHSTIWAAYTLASFVRGIAVGSGIFLVAIYFVPIPLPHPFWALLFAISGCVMLGTCGLLAGIWAEKFEQLAGLQDFIILPLTFLAGVFYSTRSLPDFWQKLAHLNPLFYIVDGFRYALIGHADVNPVYSLAVVAFCTALPTAWVLYLLKAGYKLRH